MDCKIVALDPSNTRSPRRCSSAPSCVRRAAVSGGTAAIEVPMREVRRSSISSAAEYSRRV